MSFFRSRVAVGQTDRRALRLVNLRRRPYWIGSAAWLMFFVYPLLPGSLFRILYRSLQRGERLSLQFVAIVSAILVAELAMVTLLGLGHTVYMGAFEAIESLARGNVLYAQLASGGPDSVVRSVSSGDVVTRLRDDPKDLAMLVDTLIDVGGAIVYCAAVLVVLSRIDAFATIVMLGPLAAFGIVNRVAGGRIRRFRTRARETTSDATDFLNAAFGSALTVKVSGGSAGVLRRIDRLNGLRSRANVIDLTCTDALWSLNSSVGDICIGTALVVASRRVHDAGDISLFVSYTVNLIWLPQKIGGMLIARRRFEVAADRLDALLPCDRKDVDHLTTRRSLPILSTTPVAPTRQQARIPLQRLTVSGLTIPSRNVANVSFSLERRSLTVIRGPVGSGKTSILLALLGLLPDADATVLWNGTSVEDRAAFFTPPNCAFVAQIPHLLSETLLDNVLLGRDLDPTTAIRLAALDGDVASLGQGLATRIGAGGVRLSGGQAQRAAAARALVVDAELLLFDDLTSALDVETELLMWERLSSANATVLAVSNRPAAVQRADTVIDLP